MTIALYCRVSTEEQASSGFSIEHQKERLRAFCLSQDWENYEYFVDDGHSGTHLHRPQMERLIHRIKARTIEQVVVYKLDRLSRKQADILYLLEHLFAKYNVAFRSATEPFDTSTPLGKAMIGILAVFAQLERDTIVERTKSGKEQRTKEGLWYGGPEPYGYTWNPTTQELHLIDTQAKLIRELFQRFVQGHSFRQIGQWMAARETNRIFTHHKTLIYMLQNPIYVGRLHLQGEFVQGRHPAIISEELWQRAQAEMERRQSGYARKGSYFLSGLLFCSACKSTMTHIRATDRRGKTPRIRNYYVCSRKHKNSKNCHSKWIRTEWVEQKIMEEIQHLQIDASHLRAEVNMMHIAFEQEENLREKWQKQLIDTNMKLSNLYDVLTAQELNRKEIIRRISTLENEKKSIQQCLTDEREIPEQPFWSDEKEEFLLQKYWGFLDVEEQKQIVHSCIRQIYAGLGTEIIIKWNDLIDETDRKQTGNTSS